MNQLNSVLIEGEVAVVPEMTNNSCKFIIKSKGFYTKLDELKEYISYFKIRCYGRLAQICNTGLVEGRGVRIVGHLQQTKIDGKTVIIAEHVEVKPS
jgi:single-stranded DNA-binding protein